LIHWIRNQIIVLSAYKKIKSMAFIQSIRLVFVILLVSACGDTTYQNPVIPGDFPDPSVIRVDDTYYAVGTSSEWGPHYPIYTSADLVNWDRQGYIFDEMPVWTSGSYWAPELFHYNGLFYVYYTARRKSDNISVIGVAVAEDPAEGFTDHGILVEWGNEAIDAFVFLDDDGELYMSWKAYGLVPDKPITLYANAMESDGLSLKGEAFVLIEEQNGGIEGQAIVKKNDLYYLFYAAKGCCGRNCDYQVEVARAESIKGPWERNPSNPILHEGDVWRCPGHGTPVITSDGRYFYLYHSYHANDFVYTGRQGLLDELIWREDGWPAFKHGTTPSVEAPTPYPSTQQKEITHFFENFDNDKLSGFWQYDFRYEPDKKVNNGKLHLTVTEAAASSQSGAFLGIAPKRGNYIVTTAIANAGDNQTGIAAYGDASNSLRFVVNDERLLVKKVQDGELHTVYYESIPNEKVIHLKMMVEDGYKYQFFWSLDEITWNNISVDSGSVIDGSFLPPWDRAVRAGLVVAGAVGDSGVFDYLRLDYP
jgi:xylan 1,4-beta-xylosidase